MQHQRINRTRVAAVTFIELILVIAILGALAGLAVPRIKSSFESLTLNACARELQSVMNFLSQRSIVEKSVIALTFDHEQHKYKAGFLEAEKPFKTYSLPSDISLSIIPPKEQILIYPDGRIDGATIQLINKQDEKISLTSQGVLGRVKIQN
ncbi:MAG: hypothetical protein KBA46_04145 [Candidatus Omnitrophica bacterium]|nr:hypothetical protein [Candidatus Omnitrophota bacterium]